MNFVPVDLAGWNFWDIWPILVAALALAVVGCFIVWASNGSESENIGFGFIATGMLIAIFGSVFGGLIMASSWDSDQKEAALISDGFTHVEYSVDGGYVGSDDGEFVRIEFLTVDGQQGYTVITDGEDD